MEVVEAVVWDMVRVPLEVSPRLWSYIVVSFLSCQLLYRLSDSISRKFTHSYAKLPLVEQIEWQTRVTSTVHGVIVFPICLWVMFTDSDLWFNPVFGINEWCRFCFALGVGYFASDSIVVLWYWIEPLSPILAHHVFAGWGFLLAVSDRGAACWYAGLLLCTEATALWNNTHWKLTKCGLKESTAARIVGLLFAGNWLVFRILLLPLLWYRLYLYWSQLLDLGLQLKILLTLNVFFLSALNIVYFFTGPFAGLVFGEQKKLHTTKAE